MLQAVPVPSHHTQCDTQEAAARVCSDSQNLPSHFSLAPGSTELPIPQTLSQPRHWPVVGLRPRPALSVSVPFPPGKRSSELCFSHHGPVRGLSSEPGVDIRSFKSLLWRLNAMYFTLKAIPPRAAPPLSGPMQQQLLKQPKLSQDLFPTEMGGPRCCMAQLLRSPCSSPVATSRKGKATSACSMDSLRAPSACSRTSCILIPLSPKQPP